MEPVLMASSWFLGDGEGMLKGRGHSQRPLYPPGSPFFLRDPCLPRVSPQTDQALPWKMSPWELPSIALTEWGILTPLSPAGSSLLSLGTHFLSTQGALSSSDTPLSQCSFLVWVPFCPQWVPPFSSHASSLPRAPLLTSPPPFSAPFLQQHPLPRHPLWYPFLPPLYPFSPLGLLPPGHALSSPGPHPHARVSSQLWCPFLSTRCVTSSFRGTRERADSEVAFQESRRGAACRSGRRGQGLVPRGVDSGRRIPPP